MHLLPKFNPRSGAWLALWLFTWAVAGAADRSWETVEWRDAETQGQFYLTVVEGEEVTLSRGHARRRVPSFDQSDFPEPESGCGPTAVLNWMLWMEKLGCFGAPVQRTDEVAHAEETFALIDARIRSMRQDTTARRNGSNRAQIAAVMDVLAREWSEGRVRMAMRSFQTPVKMADLLGFTKGQRAGILIGQVVENGRGGELGEFHALNLVAVDRRGGLMVNNWGERVFGHLRTYPDGQYFFPENTQQAGLKIVEALCLIPIRVKGAKGVESVSVDTSKAD